MMNTMLDLDAIRQVVIRRGDTGYESVLLDECLRLRADRDAIKSEWHTWVLRERGWIVERAALKVDLAHLRESHARLLEACECALFFVQHPGTPDTGRKFVENALLAAAEAALKGDT
jgi:hypothetical protein